MIWRLFWRFDKRIILSEKTHLKMHFKIQLQLYKDFDPLWRLYSRSSSLTYIIYEFATGRNALNQAKFCCFLLCAKIAHVITITYISECFHLGSFHKLMFECCLKIGWLNSLWNCTPKLWFRACFLVKKVIN